MSVLEDGQGKVLNVGRKTRVIPTAVRRAHKARDGCCQYPGCSQSRYVDGHDIIHWADGGETKLDNLILICRRITGSSSGIELARRQPDSSSSS